MSTSAISSSTPAYQPAPTTQPASTNGTQSTVQGPPSGMKGHRGHHHHHASSTQDAAAPVQPASDPASSNAVDVSA